MRPASYNNLQKIQNTWSQLWLVHSVRECRSGHTFAPLPQCRSWQWSHSASSLLLPLDQQLVGMAWKGTLVICMMNIFLGWMQYFLFSSSFPSITSAPKKGSCLVKLESAVPLEALDWLRRETAYVCCAAQLTCSQHRQLLCKFVRQLLQNTAFYSHLSRWHQWPYSVPLVVSATNCRLREKCKTSNH